MPLLVVAPDRLGVLSDVLATVEAARVRALPIASVALSRTTATIDASTPTNQRILQERLDLPVVTIEHHGPVTQLMDVLRPYLSA
jgi:dethiobiotin synthetase